MSVNSIAMARALVAAGFEQDKANAIAEVVVSHSDESHATKADIAELKGEIKSLAAQIKMLISLVAGLYIGLAVIIVDRLLS